jgi:tetratricopeptide (TPR) repeat protein/transglutaminase-like putative cysteine protease
MRPKAVVFGLCVLLAHAAAAQQPPSYANEAYVIEQSRTSVRFENDGTGTRELQLRIKAQSEAGVQRWGQLILGYNAANESIAIDYVRVRKADGTTIATPASAVQDLSAPVQRIAPVYTDFRQKHVTVASFRPGDTLEADVVFTVHTALAAGEFWTEYSFNQDAIVLDEEFDLDVPASRKIILKTQPGFDPTTRDAGGRRIYHWAHANTVRKDADPANKKPEASGEPERASIRVTSFADWAQVGNWFASLEQKARAITPEIKDKARTLTAGRTDGLARLEALYDFVSKDFRYVSLSLGAGRYQPRPATDVLKDAYGDCKDKATLLAALIEASGMQASPVLINSEVKLDPDFPSPSQFDHVITRAIVDGKEIWLDATPEVAPFRLLAYPLRHKQALLAEPGSGSHLVETPSDTPMPGLQETDIVGSLDAAGTLTADVKLSYRGDMELLMRMAFRQVPAAQWQKMTEGVANQGGMSGTVSNVEASNPQDTTSAFTLTFHVRSPDYLDLAGKHVNLPLPLTRSEDEPDVPEDTPIELGGNGDVIYSLKITLPADVGIQSPVPVDVTRDYGTYRSSYSADGTMFTTYRKLSITGQELPQARRSDYLAFMNVILTDYRQKASLDARSLVAPAGSSETDAKELNNRAYALEQANNCEAAAPLFQQALKADPKAANAWTNLGMCYITLREPEKAVDALRRQVELNPYDEYAYYHLGRAYVALHRYADAETAFNKQLEIDPLDKYTPSALGAMYIQQGHYDKAADAYERAVKVNPDQASPLIQLGKAYVGLHRTADALKVFDRAVQMSQTPLTWNDVAYEMALGGIDLDTAERYAESAVAALGAASRNLDIQHVDERALGVVGSLASYWDTLGWVYFAKGDVTNAERYVRAAWMVAQNPEIGDHLAQIFEKEDRRDEALHQYALAFAAPDPADLVRKHLVAIAGSDEAADALAAKYRGDLDGSRVVALPVKGRAGATADVVVLFSAPSSVEGVRVVGGDKDLTNVVDAVKATQMNGMFPDTTPAKLLRRGTIACAADKTCTLTFVRASDAKPVK